MKKKLLLYLFLIIAGGNNIMAIEKPSYTVVKKNNNIELRDYDSYIIAETTVRGDIEDAGSKAFRTLFKYISGNNKKQKKISMTSPVNQEAESEKIKMTAPVEQQKTNDSWKVSFVMPSSYTMKTIPQPNDAKVIIKEVPSRSMATIRYSGSWSEKRYIKYKQNLESWISTNNLTIAGDAVWAKYNPPFTPAFFRRNEVLIPITQNKEK